jgi:hypothetical protein
LGWVIDYFVSILAVAVTAALLGPLTSGSDMHQLYIGLTYFVVPLLYASLMESSRIQATVGKLAVGVKVTDLAGNRISLARAIGRFFAHILDGITLGIGYGMAATTERRQVIPGLNADRDILWVCGHAGVPSKVSMAVENGARLTTVAEAYLPMMCRSPNKSPVADTPWRVLTRAF